MAIYRKRLQDWICPDNRWFAFERVTGFKFWLCSGSVVPWGGGEGVSLWFWVPLEVGVLSAAHASAAGPVGWGLLSLESNAVSS